ncbi:MAG: hypothetical protein U9O82_01475 [Thermodesulfobacteriota bacterium]|nr:hypothetical protein [Thermodesulfobacteriota bacterium]
MKKFNLITQAVLLTIFVLIYSAHVSAFSFSSSSDLANKEADKRMYQKRSYQNVNVQGPQVIVLQGEIKSNNATFLQKISSNNIKDFAELELANANFRILERGDIDPMMHERELARRMGATSQDPIQEGQFKTTKWFIRFDILKAEPVAAASQGFDASTIGNIAGALLHSSRDASVARTVGSSVQVGSEADVWVIGMRYKVMDASSSEQVTSGYFEKKMEHNANATNVLGFSRDQQRGVTLDTMVQRLIQDSVSELARFK